MRIYVLFSFKLNIAIAYQVQEFVEGLQYNWEVFHHLGPAFFEEYIEEYFPDFFFWWFLPVPVFISSWVLCPPFVTCPCLPVSQSRASEEGAQEKKQGEQEVWRAEIWFWGGLNQVAQKPIGDNGNGSYWMMMSLSSWGWKSGCNISSVRSTSPTWGHSFKTTRVLVSFFGFSLWWRRDT